MKREMLIGLVGHPSSGKDTVAAYLVDTHGFTHVSSSDSVRFYIAEHQMGEANRDLMRAVSTTLREKHGADYLVRLALENEAPLLVVSGLRAIAEGEAIKKAGGVILACTTPIGVRYKRAKERGRVGDEITFETFKSQEEAETSNPNPEAQNVSAVITMADYTINNTGTISDLHVKVNDIISGLVPKR